MAQNFTGAGVFLIQTIFGIYFILIMARFLMQVARADFYNPLCQAIVKATDPAIRPLRGVFPSIGRVDLATLVLALVVQLIAVALVMFLIGHDPFQVKFIGWVLLGMVSTILDIYFFALLILVIASWIAPMSTNPFLLLIYQLTEPLCTPARRLLPPMGGIDFSIILVFVTITLIDNYLLIKPLANMLNIPQGIIMGL